MLTNRGSNISANSVLVEDSHRIEVAHCVFNEVSVAALTVRGGADRSADDIWALANVFRPLGNDPTAQVTGLGFRADQYFGSEGSHWIYAGPYQTDDAWEHTSGTKRLVVVDNIFAGSAAGRDVGLGPRRETASSSTTPSTATTRPR